RALRCSPTSAAGPCGCCAGWTNSPTADCEAMSALPTRVSQIQAEPSPRPVFAPEQLDPACICDACPLRRGLLRIRGPHAGDRARARRLVGREDHPEHVDALAVRLDRAGTREQAFGEVRHLGAELVHGLERRDHGLLTAD